MDPPTGSPSYHAQQVLKAQYPLSANEDVVAIVVQQEGAGPSAAGTRVGVAEASASSSDGLVFSPDAGYDFSGFSAALNRSVGKYASNGGAVTAFQPSLVLEGGSKKAFAADYFTLTSLSLGSFAWQAVAPNPLANFSLPPPDEPSNVTSLAFRLILAGDDKKKEDTGDWLQDELSVLCDRYFLGGKAECLLTGAPLFMQQISQGTEQSMIHGESIAAPIAIVILGVLVRSGRLLARECSSISIPICTHVYIPCIYILLTHS